MPNYVHTTISWMVTAAASKEIAAVRTELGDGYDENVVALRHMLCNYFSAVDGCVSKSGKTISPMGATGTGGKILKVRWSTPGGGKSGGLRLCVVAYCDDLRVVLTRAILRSDEPDDDDFLGTADESDATATQPAAQPKKRAPKKAKRKAAK